MFQGVGMPENREPESGGQSSPERGDVGWLGLEPIPPPRMEPGEMEQMQANPGAFVLDQLVEGYPVWEIVEKLVAGGADREKARALVDRLQAQNAGAIKGERRKVGVSKVVVGIVFMVAGAGISAGLTLAFGPGPSLIASGLVLAGGVMVLAGLWQTARG